MGLVKTFNFLVKLSFGRDLFLSYRTAILIPLFSLAIYILYLLFPLIFGRVSGDYLSAVFDTKVTQHSERLSSLTTLLFGTNDSSSFILGGDFVMLSFISGLGLIALLYFICLTYTFLLKSYFLSSTNTLGTSSSLFISLVSLSMLLVASIHYGVFFSIFSQIICASFIVPQIPRASLVSTDL